MADPAYVGQGTYTNTTTLATTINPPYPGGAPVAGHTAILHIVCSAFGTGSVTPTIVGPGAGWTQIGSEAYASGFANTRAPRQQIWKRTLVGGDAAPGISMTGGVNNGTSMFLGGVITTYSDVGTATIVASSVGDTSPIGATGVTTTKANSVILGFVGIGDSDNLSAQSFTNPASVTERYDHTTSVRLGMNLVTGVRTTAGATGNYVATMSAIDPWTAHVVALEAADAAGAVFSPTITATLQAQPALWIPMDCRMTGTWTIGMTVDAGAAWPGGGVGGPGKSKVLLLLRRLGKR